MKTKKSSGLKQVVTVVKEKVKTKKSSGLKQVVTVVKEKVKTKKSKGWKRVLAALMDAAFVVLHIDPSGIGALIMGTTGALGVIHGITTGTVKKYLIGTLAALIGVSQAFPALQTWEPLFRDLIVILGGAALGEAIGRNTNVTK